MRGRDPLIYHESQELTKLSLNMSVFVIPVFNHGEKLVRANGKLHYLDGKVEKFPPMDIDFVNKKDLEELFKGLGYLTYKQIYWHDPTVIEFEDGLHVLYGDKEINNMCDFTMRNNLKEFHLYFEHGVDIPDVTDDEPVEEEMVSEDEDVLAVTDSSKSSSSSYDSYESAEDEAYNLPPPGYKTDSSEESVDVQSKKKKNGKSCSPNTMAKRRASRRYTGKRRRKHVLNREIENGPSSGDSWLGQGPGSGGCVGPYLEWENINPMQRQCFSSREGVLSPYNNFYSHMANAVDNLAST
ncbi:hypothetical protein Ahy_A07g036434 [Arachis hypogaea]|uniref:PB1-like domain-containing protein n=1 Tax=Arachis hypogaea TaxID=3818 RepID=A0A445CG66_ARAHY|nr:hypothetical protein Ahy_A07g036434 [Arachis hypogaea]